jgi:FkbM family methyltransferase
MRRPDLEQLLRCHKPEIQIYETHFYGASRKNLWYSHLRRLFHYRHKYALYLALTIAKKKLLCQAHTFWGRDIYVVLPDSEGLKLYLMHFITPNELPLALYFIRNLKEEDIFFDVGASYGFYAALASELVPSQNVHAFEPNPEITPALRKTFADTHVHVNYLALADTTGKTTFYKHTVFLGTQSSSIVVKKTHASETIIVPSDTLDRYCAACNTYPTFIKMDVEGAEGAVIEGGRDVLRTYRPRVSIEVWGNGLHKYYSWRAVEALLEIGYIPNRIKQDGTLEPLGQRGREILPSHYDNFIFT